MKSVGPNADQAGFQGIGRDMAERLGLGPEVRELKLGPTFTNNKTTSFHTLKYDFKPASVDVSKMATVDVGPNNTMTVTVPHLDGAGIPHTVFKGSQRPYSKECVLIIDRITGEITLERLSSNIQVKKTRVEQKSQSSLMAVPSSNNLLNRPNTPIEYRRSPTHGRTSSRTKVTSGKKRDPTVQLHSKPPPSLLPPQQHQPNPMRASPYRGKSPSTINNSSAIQSSSSVQHSTNLLASLPMIGSDFDDFHSPPPITAPQSLSSASLPKINPERSSLANNLLSTSTARSSAITSTTRESDVGVLSDSSTTSSSSDSSDSDSEPENVPVPSAISKTNGHTNGKNTSSPSLLMNMPDNLLNDDLQLSESESDSD